MRITQYNDPKKNKNMKNELIYLIRKSVKTLGGKVRFDEKYVLTEKGLEQENANVGASYDDMDSNSLEYMYNYLYLKRIFGNSRYDIHEMLKNL